MRFNIHENDRHELSILTIKLEKKDLIFDLTISAKNKVFKVGEDIDIEVVLENRRTKPIKIYRYGNESLFSFFINSDV